MAKIVIDDTRIGEWENPTDYSGESYEMPYISPLVDPPNITPEAMGITDYDIAPTADPDFLIPEESEYEAAPWGSFKAIQDGIFGQGAHEATTGFFEDWGETLWDVALAGGGAGAGWQLNKIASKYLPKFRGPARTQVLDNINPKNFRKIGDKKLKDAFPNWRQRPSNLKPTPHGGINPRPALGALDKLTLGNATNPMALRGYTLEYVKSLPQNLREGLVNATGTVTTKGLKRLMDSPAYTKYMHNKITTNWRKGADDWLTKKSLVDESRTGLPTKYNLTTSPGGERYGDLRRLAEYGDDVPFSGTKSENLIKSSFHRHKPSADEVTDALISVQKSNPKYFNKLIDDPGIIDEIFELVKDVDTPFK